MTTVAGDKPSNRGNSLAGDKRKRGNNDSRATQNPLALFEAVERSKARSGPDRSESSHENGFHDRPASSVVTLNPAEVEVATVIGTYREKVSGERGFHDDSHRPASASLEQNVDAAGAELAASKATGCRWNMTTGEDLDEPDLWPHVEVRHSTRKNGGLIVRPKDKPDRLFVLVVGTLPTYRVIGWMQGENARRQEHRWQEVWKVPQSRLTRFGAS